MYDDVVVERPVIHYLWNIICQMPVSHFLLRVIEVLLIEFSSVSKVIRD